MSQTTRAHIFCIHGSPEFLDVLRYFFQDEHYQVTTTNFVPHTFDHIVGITPDLLLIDLVFGRTQGWDLLERLHLDAVTNDIPVIVTSTDQRLLQRAHEERARYGGELFMVTPLDLDELLAAVQVLTERERRSSLSTPQVSSYRSTERGVKLGRSQ